MGPDSDPDGLTQPFLALRQASWDVLVLADDGDAVSGYGQVGTARDASTCTRSAPAPRLALTPRARDAVSSMAAVRVGRSAGLGYRARPRVGSRHPEYGRSVAALRSECLPVEPERVERYLFAILQPESAGAIRTRESADGGGTQGIVYAKYHDLRPPRIRPLDGARYASALGADEVATDVTVAGKLSAGRQNHSPGGRGVFRKSTITFAPPLRHEDFIITGPSLPRQARSGSCAR